MQQARWPLDIIESLEKGFLWKVSCSYKKACLLANRQFLYVNLCCVFMIVGEWAQMQETTWLQKMLHIGW